MHRVVYQLNLHDMRRYVRTLMFDMYRGRMFRFAALAVLAMAIAPVVSGLLGGLEPARLARVPGIYARLWPLLAAGALTIAAALFWLSPEIMARRLLGLGKGAITATLQPEGLHRSDAGGESILRWSGIEGILDSKGQLLFVVTKAKAAANVVPVPRRAFPSPADADAFLAEARRLWSTARAAPPPA